MDNFRVWQSVKLVIKFFLMNSLLVKVASSLEEGRYSNVVPTSLWQSHQNLSNFNSERASSPTGAVENLEIWLSGRVLYHLRMSNRFSNGFHFQHYQASTHFRAQFSHQIQADHDKVRLNSDRFTSATCRRKRLFANLISINMFDKNFIGCSFAAFSANLLFSFRFKTETLIAGTD